MKPGLVRLRPSCAYATCRIAYGVSDKTKECVDGTGLHAGDAVKVRRNYWRYLPWSDQISVCLECVHRPTSDERTSLVSCFVPAGD